MEVEVATSSKKLLVDPPNDAKLSFSNKDLGRVVREWPEETRSKIITDLLKVKSTWWGIQLTAEIATRQVINSIWERLAKPDLSMINIQQDLEAFCLLAGYMYYCHDNGHPITSPNDCLDRWDFYVDTKHVFIIFNIFAQNGDRQSESMCFRTLLTIARCCCMTEEYEEIEKIVLKLFELYPNYPKEVSEILAAFVKRSPTTRKLILSSKIWKLVHLSVKEALSPNLHLDTYWRISPEVGWEAKVISPITRRKHNELQLIAAVYYLNEDIPGEGLLKESATWLTESIKCAKVFLVKNSHFSLIAASAMVIANAAYESPMACDIIRKEKILTAILNLIDHCHKQAFCDHVILNLCKALSQAIYNEEQSVSKVIANSGPDILTRCMNSEYIRDQRTSCALLLTFIACCWYMDPVHAKRYSKKIGGALAEQFLHHDRSEMIILVSRLCHLATKAQSSLLPKHSYLSVC